MGEANAAGAPKHTLVSQLPTLPTLAARPHPLRSRFCVAVLNRLVRLSYWDRIQSVLPQEFRVLLPPKPEVGGRAGGCAWAGAAPCTAGAVAACLCALPVHPALRRRPCIPHPLRSWMPARCLTRAPSPWDGATLQVEALPDPSDAAAAAADPEGAAAAQMLARVRSKATPEELDSWQAEEDLAGRLGGALGVLRCWARCLLVAGAKSYTHMVTALERYYGPLKNAVDAAGLEVSEGMLLAVRKRRLQAVAPAAVPPCTVVLARCLTLPPAPCLPHRWFTQGEAALVDAANRVWRRSPQRAAMAVDRLMTLRLVSADAIVE